MSKAKILLSILFSLLTITMFAQTRTVRGVVFEEETGQPLPAATVSIDGTTRGVITDLDGSFELSGVKPTDKLKVEFVGKETQVIPVEDRKSFMIKLKDMANELEGTTIVAFGTQKKESVIGSITSIDVQTLKVPSSNLTTALAGNVAGVIAYQRSGEPGQDNADFFVRGITTFGANTSPLILIDNIELTSTDLARLQPDDIESFSIMKDATATALYGARGANGVIFVTTKRGQEGPAKIFARVETSISQPTDVVELADPVTYMKSYNEAISTRDPLGALRYSYDKIEQTGKPGANRIIYPANDWYDMLFKDYATAYRANVSARGGGKVARYYVAGAFTEDTGILKVDKRNSFNNNIDQKTYTLRSNVDINITKSTKLAVRLTGNFTDYTGPISGGNAVYRSLMHADPVLFPAYYPVDEDHVGIQHIMFGNYDAGGYTNPYANLVYGYRDYQRSQMIAAVELNQDLDFITKGLHFMTLFNLTRLSSFSVNRHFNPFWYTLDSYDSYTNEYHIQRINENGTDYLGYSEGDKEIQNTMYSESRLNYSREFGRNEVTGLLVLTSRESLRANAGSLQLSLPSRNAGLSGRFTYGFDKKYFAEFNFGYNGSERFYKTQRWGFFPSFGGAWVVSNEKFFEPAKKVVSNLKLRASYGIVGNDNIGSASNRFYYLSQMNMTSNSNAASFGVGSGNTYQGIDVTRYANEDITWEKSYKANYAIELGLFKKFDMIAEYFTEHRTDIFMARADVPITMGLQAGISANIGEAKAHGIDIQADYKQSWSNGLWASARANFTYSSSEFLVYEEPTYKESYRQHVGHSLKQTWGYIAERLFIDDEEAANSPSQQAFGVQYGGGDIKYTDVNGDGVITNADRVPIGFPTSPEVIYGFGFSFGQKGFDFSVFFQGLARESFWIDATNAYNARSNKFGTAPFTNNGQLLKAYADSHWSEDNRDIYALWPRYSAYHSTNNSAVSTWWMRDGSFLRLKQLELGYSLPQKWTNKIHIDNLRFYVQGNNLFCWSKFKLWDPELAGEGFNYPIQRTINIGLNVTFK